MATSTLCIPACECLSLLAWIPGSCQPPLSASQLVSHFHFLLVSLAHANLHSLLPSLLLPLTSCLDPWLMATSTLCIPACECLSLLAWIPGSWQPPLSASQLVSDSHFWLGFLAHGNLHYLRPSL